MIPQFLEDCLSMFIYVCQSLHRCVCLHLGLHRSMCIVMFISMFASTCICISLFIDVYIYVDIYVYLFLQTHKRFCISKLPRYFTSGYAWISSSLHLALPVPTQSTSATRTLSSSLYSWMHICGVGAGNRLQSNAHEPKNIWKPCKTSNGQETQILANNTNNQRASPYQITNTGVILTIHLPTNKHKSNQKHQRSYTGLLHEGVPGRFHVFALATPRGEKFQENGLSCCHLLALTEGSCGENMKDILPHPF